MISYVISSTEQSHLKRPKTEEKEGERKENTYIDMRATWFIVFDKNLLDS